VLCPGRGRAVARPPDHGSARVRRAPPAVRSDRVAGRRARGLPAC
jgi:hypothetical protein